MKSLACSTGVFYGQALNNKFGGGQVILSLRVAFDSPQPFHASSRKMAATEDYLALMLQKNAGFEKLNLDAT